MKKIVIIIGCLLAFVNTTLAQEWFTSFDVAKRMALVQNKLLFVIWEDSFKPPYYIMAKNSQNKNVVIDFTDNNDVKNVIWDYFIPVLLPESKYGDLLFEAKKHAGEAYLGELDDDYIKIMDVNGNIVNNAFSTEDIQNLPLLISKYALDTSFLNPYLRNYLKKRNFATSFTLGAKYHDFALFAIKDIRKELIKLSKIYLKEAKRHLAESDLTNRDAFEQKLDFYEIKELLILNNSKKARRLLKRIALDDVKDINQSLFVFLNYTTFILLKDEINAATWRAKITQADLKKASLILKAHN